MKLNEFGLAWGAQPAPPCERYGCSLRAQCSADGLACDAFVHYVQTGGVVAPHACFYAPGKMLLGGKVRAWNDAVVATPQKLAEAMR